MGNPARVPIGPFLTVYFEGMPLKEALAHWKNGTVRNGGLQPEEVAQQVVQVVPAAPIGNVAQEPPLPLGWEKRESRSKKGVFYYANPSKGLSQMERPTK